MLSEKDITKFLQALGFSKREVQIYIFLAKAGVQTTSFVAKRLKMERVQAYRTFKKLQEKGFIEATLERPTRFTVVPFEKLFEGFLETRKSELTSLNDQKEELLSAWHSVSAPEAEYAVAKFSIITGKKKIHLKMLNMVEEAKKGIFSLTSGAGLIQEDLAGVFDPVEHPSPETRHPAEDSNGDFSRKPQNSRANGQEIQRWKSGRRMPPHALRCQAFPQFPHQRRRRSSPLLDVGGRCAHADARGRRLMD